MVSCLNREAVACANSWKRTHSDLVGDEEKMPHYVKNVPSIDLKDPAFKEVMSNIKLLEKKSLKLRGDTVPRYDFIFICVLFICIQ